MIAPIRRGSPRLIVAAIATLAALAAVAMTIGTQTAESATYKRCSLSGSEQQPSSGKPTYNLSLRKRNTTCTTAKRVMKAYHACRSRLSVTCSRRVRTHWKCTARKTSNTRLSFYASYTCTYGTRGVKGTYQQNK